MHPCMNGIEDIVTCVASEPGHVDAWELKYGGLHLLTQELVELYNLVSIRSGCRLIKTTKYDKKKNLTKKRKAV